MTAAKDLWQVDKIDSVFKADLFDLDDYQTATKIVPDLEKSDTEAGQEYVGHPVQDGFFGLYKPAPELLSPAGSLAPLSELIQKGMETPAWERLRENSVGQIVGSAIGSQHFIKNVLSQIPQEIKDEAQDAAKKQQQAQDAQEKAQGLESLAQALAQAAAGMGEGSTEGAQLQEQADQAQAQAASIAQQAEDAQEAADAAYAAFQEAMENNEAQVLNALNQAADEAADEAQEANDVAKAFGIAGGSDGNHVDTETARAAMQALKDNPNLTELANLLGWAKRMVRGEWRQAAHGNKNMTGYRQHELQPHKMASSERLAMTSPSPALRLDFQRRVIENDITHRHYDGEEEQGKGPLVLVRDESGSMSGHDHSTAVALEWALLEMARKDNRDFYSIPFSGSGKFHVWQAPEKGKPDPNGLLAHLSHFYGGGTEPYGPMTKALDLISKQDLEADVLVLTDGSFGTPPQDFLSKADAQPDTKIVTVVIGGYTGQADKFSDKVVTLSDLFNDRDKLREAVKELV